MGNSQGNPRKVTLVNDDSTVIKVSEPVMQRVREGKSTEGKPSSKPQQAPPVVDVPSEKPPPPPLPEPAKQPPPPPEPGPIETTDIVTEPQREYPKPTFGRDSIVPATVPPSLVPKLNEEAHLALMRLRQEREEEIRNLEAHWQQKLLDVENQYVMVQKLTSEEFEKAANEVESLFNKKVCEVPCQTSENKLLECYKTHPNQSLRCSAYVKDFTNCINKFRLERTL